MRIIAPFIFGIAFIAWLGYRIYKRDLRKHLGEMGFGFFFLAVWAFIYGVVLS